MAIRWLSIRFPNPGDGGVVLNPDGTGPLPGRKLPPALPPLNIPSATAMAALDTATVTVNVGSVRRRSSRDRRLGFDPRMETLRSSSVLPGIVTPNDTDLDGDTLVISAVSNPSNGSVVLNPDGTVTFTPNANFHGTATFDYTISDGNGGTDTATVTVNVGSVNDVPDAIDDSVSTDEDTDIILSVSDIVTPNDTDLDGDTLVISAVSNPSNGSVVLNPDGTVTFTPDANFHGTATFDYTISDGNGGTDTATVTVNVGSVNDAPVAIDDSVSTDEDTAIVLGISDIVDPNDTDLDGDTLVITAVSNPSNGSVVLNSDGTVTFTPDANFHGTATFDYTISDGNGGTDTATVTVNVGSVNDAPVAIDDSVSTDEDTAIVLGISDIVDPNDTDLDGDTLVITAVSNPSNGSVVLNSDGTVTFTPDANFHGTATFDYTISDGNGGSDTATVTVNVGSVNDGPVAINDSVSTDEDTTLVLSISEIVTPTIPTWTVTPWSSQRSQILRTARSSSTPTALSPLPRTQTSMALPPSIIPSAMAMAALTPRRLQSTSARSMTSPTRSTTRFQPTKTPTSSSASATLSPPTIPTWTVTPWSSQRSQILRTARSSSTRTGPSPLPRTQPSTALPPSIIRSATAMAAPTPLR